MFLMRVVPLYCLSSVMKCCLARSVRARRVAELVRQHSTTLLENSLFCCEMLFRPLSTGNALGHCINKRTAPRIVQSSCQGQVHLLRIEANMATSDHSVRALGPYTRNMPTRALRWSKEGAASYEQGYPVLSFFCHEVLSYALSPSG